MMSPPDKFDDEAGVLAHWLAGHLAQAEDVACQPLERTKLGMSNDTRIVDATWTEGGQPRARRFVLRCGSDSLPVHPLQTGAVPDSVALQYRVMAALAVDGSIPIARLLPYEADRQWLGRPFFLMEHVPGWVPSDHPAYTEAGPFFDTAPDQRRSFIAEGLAMLARIHRVDWRKVDLGWLDRAPGNGPRMPAQIDLWRDYCRPILDGTPFPVLSRALDWLEANFPEEPPPSLVWGDARPQNMIYDEMLRPRLVMDWEGAAIMPAEADIAYWVVNDRMVHERLDRERLPGVPDRAEQYAIFSAQLGRPLIDSGYYEIFASMTIAATMFNVLTALEKAGVDHGFGTPTGNYFSRTLDGFLAERLDA